MMLNKTMPAATEEQKRYLTFAAILFTENGHSCDELQIKNKIGIKRMLRKWWGIKDRSEAVKTAESLSIADEHTPFADDVFNEFIKKDRRPPLTAKGLWDLTGLENAYRSSVRRALLIAEIPDNEITPELLEEVMVKDEYQEGFMGVLFDRLAIGLECYKVANDVLIRAGYPEEELEQIKTLSAWDYGRTGIIARYGANVGYLREDEAWQYMKTAAENSAGVYSGWREHFAAYILGRAVAYGDDCTDLYETMDYLLNSAESPILKIPFK